jgi:hypothetical protein
MRFPKIHVLFLALFSVWGSGVAAQTLEQWRCTTESFKSFDDADQGFIKKNLRKQFLLTVTEDEILVKTISKEFKDHEQRYQIIGKDLLAKYAVSEIEMGVDVIAMPNSP